MWVCGAKTRSGGACQCRPVHGSKRCRLHGGLSTGPKTAAGRERIAEAQRRRHASHRKTVMPRP
ncbi:HGGxSTG domain-containing protein [Celeribacter indicus]|uniref:HGGxSTG domain-containing protein n=1 Tax=Celeribacter indicus TaxID=1208324 RepID=UPI0009430BB4|nr:HGGxSTG domain-containing protein [Celeribacter indicus]